MTDDLNALLSHPAASAARPLTGLTVLVVEDSRFASEAMRLLCLRSGARIRRADCLRSAHRHLATYRPGVVIVDMGLPDGSGADLIREIKAMQAPVPVVLGTSGESGLEAEALAAGADGFMPKPLESLAQFQQTILAALPDERRPQGLYALSDAVIAPDPIALQDDLHHMAEVLSDASSPAQFGYVAQFLAGVARSAHDPALETAAEAVGRDGGPSPEAVSHLSSLMQDRIAAGARF
ncbi:response regulator [Pseudothioclava nitratireducens]|jgi:CheY-like chemotaxis protein|uniref:response regulator n=1 Tax=Pseudothioclava nitratireducens TaxID=1928646 RepID=UPI0023DBD3EB|nr:response regulator [Defluviimonas nitratireducens]MDF1618978.1 response regulator [Defluviimonas nitratireducens]